MSDAAPQFPNDETRNTINNTTAMAWRNGESSQSKSLPILSKVCSPNNSTASSRNPTRSKQAYRQ